MRAASSARTGPPLLLLSASPRKAIPSFAPPPPRDLPLALALGRPPPRRLPPPWICSMAVASVAALERHDAGDWYSVPDLSLRDHRFTVPLDYSAAAGSSITVFAREVVAGTVSLPDYLRAVLAMADEHRTKAAAVDEVVDGSGQEGLKSVLLTGGLPPIAKGCTADVVYRACFEQVVHQNEKYYKRFPQDVKVPVAAAVYYEDMYVNFKLAMETASEIAGIRLWVTNEYMHSGLRDNGYQVLEQLIGMLQGKKPWF
ncbi:hypothetical protein B296_00050830 [Ensete ventricosum]|uniref:AB hydrolase-1 domain-containing protein n=1 Tax=Ensete ventricosum TaxID=4639 RepID=A0A426YJG8_ENSVE|nr:hypothetical protein B296_00050830 [Ensete ventricosum]